MVVDWFGICSAAPPLRMSPKTFLWACLTLPRAPEVLRLLCPWVYLVSAVAPKASFLSLRAKTVSSRRLTPSSKLAGCHDSGTKVASCTFRELGRQKVVGNFEVTGTPGARRWRWPTPEWARPSEAGGARRIGCASLRRPLRQCGNPLAHAAGATLSWQGYRSPHDAQPGGGGATLPKRGAFRTFLRRERFRHTLSGSRRRCTEWVSQCAGCCYTPDSGGCWSVGAKGCRHSSSPLRAASAVGPTPPQRAPTPGKPASGGLAARPTPLLAPKHCPQRRAEGKPPQQ
jgi:hypothetical protein